MNRVLLQWEKIFNVKLIHFILSIIWLLIYVPIFYKKLHRYSYKIDGWIFQKTVQLMPRKLKFRKNSGWVFRRIRSVHMSSTSVIIVDPILSRGRNWPINTNLPWALWWNLMEIKGWNCHTTNQIQLKDFYMSF